MRYDRDALVRLLREAREAEATDIHLKTPSRPRFRIMGGLVQTPYPALRPEDTMALAQGVLDLAHKEVALARITDLQVGFGVHRQGRFRAHMYRQRGSIGLVVHRMALTVPSLTDMGAPEDLAEQVWGSQGLVLTTGRMDRIRLLAGLTDAYNQSRPGCLFTVEEPMEFLHMDARAVISQREVGVDVPDVASGLAGALGADCDAAMVTDLPDAASAELALRMAETGRTVVAGLAGCAWEEAARVFIRRFPAHREAEIADRVHRCLAGVVHTSNDQVTMEALEDLAG
jgi:twitching motility protein PilT